MSGHPSSESAYSTLGSRIPGPASGGGGLLVKHCLQPGDLLKNPTPRAPDLHLEEKI